MADWVAVWPVSQIRDNSLLAFAGLWDRWQRDGQLIESCTIIVGEPEVKLR